MQNVMKIDINETPKAFRVNGVTVAKRHLVNTLSKDWDGDMEKILAKFLVIVPFLATSYTPHKDANESVKYGALKAKRLYEALGITEDNTLPFMLVALHQAGDLTIDEMGKAVRVAGFYNEGKVEIKDPSFPEGEVSQARKPTLH